MALEDFFTANDDAALAARTRRAVSETPGLLFEIAREVGRTECPPPDAVTRACAEELGCVEELTGRQIREGFESALLERNVDVALQWLQQIGAIKLLLPELEACRDLQQEAGRAHKDVWEHTKLVVKQSVKRPIVRWAALLHDIGKVPTRTFTERGVHFHGHAEVGARMYDKIARRMQWAREDKRAIRFLIKHHLRSNQYGPDWTDSAVRRFAREMDAHLVDLLDLSRADITSKRPGRRKALLRSIHDLQERIGKLREQDAVVAPLRKGIGITIIEHFQLPPSKLIGDLKRALEQAVERGELEPHRDDAYYIDWLEQSGLVPGREAAVSPADGHSDSGGASDARTDSESTGPSAG